MNDILFHRLKGEEGFRQTIYQDQFGNRTIGYGWCIDKNPMKPDLGELVLKYHIDEVEGIALGSFPEWYPALSPIRQSVILDAIYNLGINNFLGFRKMIQAIKDGDHDKVVREMLDSTWYHQVPNRVNALASLWLKG